MNRAATPDFTDLIRAVAEDRDREAFAEIFAYFAPRLKSFGLRGGAAPDVAEELAQDTMVTVWRKAASYDPSKAALSTWIFTIARNRRIDMVRRERRPELDASEPSLVPAAAASGETVVAARQIGVSLRRAVDDLPPDQKQVLELAFYADRTHSEIASQLELPIGTVKSRIRLGLKKVEGAIKESNP